jgi:hypothetical protein
VLRFEPITPFTARICVEPVAFRGVEFPADGIVAICAAQADRETPDGDRLDITAEHDGRVLTFGAGAHYCLGADLASAELEEALAFRAPRMPGLTADGPAGLGGVEGIYRVSLRSTSGSFGSDFDRTEPTRGSAVHPRACLRPAGVLLARRVAACLDAVATGIPVSLEDGHPVR